MDNPFYQPQYEYTGGKEEAEKERLGRMLDMARINPEYLSQIPDKDLENMIHYAQERLEEYRSLYSRFQRILTAMETQLEDLEKSDAVRQRILMRKPLHQLPFSVRVYTALHRCGIETLADLCAMTEAELSASHYIRRDTIPAVKEVLATLGLSLKQEAP